MGTESPEKWVDYLRYEHSQDEVIHMVDIIQAINKRESDMSIAEKLKLELEPIKLRYVSLDYQRFKILIDKIRDENREWNRAKDSDSKDKKRFDFYDMIADDTDRICCIWSGISHKITTREENNKECLMENQSESLL